MKVRIPRIPFLSRLIPLQGSILYADGNQIVLLIGKHFEMVVSVLPTSEEAERVVERLSEVNPAMMDTFQYMNWLNESGEEQLKRFSDR